MGDIIHAWPVAASLRASWPQAKIAWAVERKWQPLVAGHPALDAVFPVDTHAARSLRGSWRILRRELRRVREFQADWALDLQGTWKSAMVTRASRARLRVGAADPKEFGSGWVLNRRVRSSNQHVVERWLDVAAGAGCERRTLAFDFPIPAEVQGEVDQWLQDNRIGDFVFLSPGGGWAAKRWPTLRYSELAAKLQEDYGLSAVLNRGPGESQSDDAYRRANQIRAFLFSGDVTHLSAVLRRAKLAVGGDTGPMQLAGALGVPLVALFGPTDPERNRPFGARGPAGVVLRKPGFATTYKRGATFSPAMLAITVEEVAAASAEQLRIKAPQPGV